MSKTGGLWLNVSVPPGASVSEIPLFSALHYSHFGNTHFVRLIHLIVEPCFKTEFSSVLLFQRWRLCWARGRVETRSSSRGRAAHKSSQEGKSLHDMPEIYMTFRYLTGKARWRLSKTQLSFEGILQSTLAYEVPKFPLNLILGH